MSATATAIAYSPVRIDVPRRRAPQRVRVRAPQILRPWSEVTVADRPLQAIGGHPRHIKGSHLAWLIAIVVVLHATFAWYIAMHTASREPLPTKAELNIEIVRPPKQVDPPKVEPPKPQPQKVQPK